MPADPKAKVLRGRATHGVSAMGFDLDLTRSAPMSSGDRAAVDQAASDGYATGYEAGRQDGYQAGMALARDEAAQHERDRAATVDPAVDALRAATEALRQARIDGVETVEQDIAAAAFGIAEAIVGRELALAAHPGVDAVTRALALAPEGAVVVRLHPDDVDSIDGGAFGRELTVLADPTVERSGAILEVGACRIDAQIGSALDRVREALA